MAAPRLSILVLAALAVLATASIAAATFTSSASSGPMAISSSTLTAPGGLTATANCVKHVSVDVALSWTASNFASGYTVWRKTGAGAFSKIATLGAGLTAFDDTTVALSTSYSYMVIAGYQSWTATSSTATATTLNNNCK